MWNICLAVYDCSKLSTQQKTILVALREPEDGQEFIALHRLVLILTGVDTWELERQNRDFYRSRARRPGWRQAYDSHSALENPRPIYDSNRQKSNKAFATVSRSIARLVERGLVSWSLNKRNRRYPVLTDEGRRVLSEMSRSWNKQIAAKINEIDEALSNASKENEKELSGALRQLAFNSKAKSTAPGSTPTRARASAPLVLESVKLI